MLFCSEKLRFWLMAIVLTVLPCSLWAEETNDFPLQPAIRALSPSESFKTIQLPPGYKLELVLSEPDILEPVVTVFDGDGRMFVAEMRSYMQEIDGKDEITNVSRVSLHWSSKKNGKFDKHTVFVDKLVLPRMILPLGKGQLLINETDTDDIWLYTDTDGDGVADKKELWYSGGPRGGNLEHQPSGLIWSLDNWIYSTYNAHRFRYNGPGKPPLKEPTAPNGGQWGLTQDNYGKPWFVDAGGEQGPVNFQEPIVYGGFKVADQEPADYREVWPLVGLADVQGGTIRFRPENKTLNHFTATCGQAIFRGDRLPKDLQGDLLFGEPVGRLIRRSKVEVKDGLTFIHNAYDKTEFIRSTDPSFRPINMVTAPDGCLYIVDMYRGIIQEGNWVREGSYLRKVVKQYSLDKIADHGRVWRLTHQDFKPGPQPKMYEESSAKLVKHLEHPNGWWRDTAQKLLILRGDKSVMPALLKMAKTSKNPLARIHSIWTLEGLGAITPEFIQDRLQDSDPQVRIAAIRAGETLLKKGNPMLMTDILGRIKDPAAEVVIQVMMTAKFLKYTNAETLIKTSIAEHSSRGVEEIGGQLLLGSAVAESRFTAAEQRTLNRGKAIYQELCFACHGLDGKGAVLEGKVKGLTQAPPLSKSDLVQGHPDEIINILLHGLTGPVGGKTYPAQMVSMASNDDGWVAAVASFVRNSFGNHAPMIVPLQVAKIRTATKGRDYPHTVEELESIVPQFVPHREQWKLSASHHPELAKNAVDGKADTRYDTGVQQTPGMWFQVELPNELNLCGVELDALGSPRDFPRGYEVTTSNDGVTWSKPVAKGKGEEPLTEILFKPVKAKFLRITQTGTMTGLFWSIHELQLYQSSDKPSVKVDTKRPDSKYE